jgi:hypothetical protein
LGGVRPYEDGTFPVVVVCPSPVKEGELGPVAVLNILKQEDVDRVFVGIGKELGEGLLASTVEIELGKRQSAIGEQKIVFSSGNGATWRGTFMGYRIRG